MSKNKKLNPYLKLNIFEELLENLNDKIIGQNEAKKEIIDSLELNFLNSNFKLNGTISNLLFVGPSGVGKTETVRALSELLLGNNRAYTKIDCGQYKSLHQKSILLGSPPSYVGSSTIPLLSGTNVFKHSIKALRKGTMHKGIEKYGEDFAIVLLDEFEKMHPEMQDIFLGIFDEGFLTLDNGNESDYNKNSRNSGESKLKYEKVTDFRNTIFILTSNAGTKKLSKELSGEKISFSEKKNFTIDFNKWYEKELSKFLRPEFLSRINKIVPFSNLTKENYLTKLDSLIEDASQKLIKNFNVSLKLNKKAKDEILKEGISPDKGARPLKNAFDSLIFNPSLRITSSTQIIEEDMKNPQIYISFNLKEKFVFELRNDSNRIIKEEDSLISREEIAYNNSFKSQAGFLESTEYRNSYIHFLEEVVIENLKEYQHLYQYREEYSSTFIEDLKEIEKTLQSIGFTDFDLKLCRDNITNEEMDNIDSFYSDFEGVLFYNDNDIWNKNLPYIKKYVKRKLKYTNIDFKNGEDNSQEYIKLTTDIESFVCKLLRINLLNSEERKSVLILIHKSYLEINKKSNNFNKIRNKIKIIHNSKIVAPLKELNKIWKEEDSIQILRTLKSHSNIIDATIIIEKTILDRQLNNIEELILEKIFEDIWEGRKE